MPRRDGTKTFDERELRRPYQGPGYGPMRQRRGRAKDWGGKQRYLGQTEDVEEREYAPQDPLSERSPQAC
jgi:hypothetical protein